jgi:hypothetical protein
MSLDCVVCRLDGGLGNQLFQYAAARSLADTLGCDLALDLRAIGPQANRSFGLNAFTIRAEVADDALLRRLPAPRSSRVGRIRSAASLAFPGITPYSMFWPRSFAYDARLLQVRQPKFLVGYWQSEKYFVWNRARLLDDLQLRTKLALDAKLLQHIQSCPSVAVHIRRGDYVTHAAAAGIHGVCEPRYYQDAAHWMAQHIPGLQLFVFSDDMVWVRAHFDFGLPTVFVDNCLRDSPLLDFALMRACKHHVISNSTFSWWAAWLADVPEQIVIAPKRWFVDKSIPSQDVVPDHWIKM